VTEGDDDRVQVWVHPNWQFAGGEYDPQTARTNLGGAWAERVQRTLDAFDGDSVAVTNAELGPEHGKYLYEDGDAPTWVTGPHTNRPYGDGWDEVYEDPTDGAVPPAEIADLVGGYDEVVVRGGYYSYCQLNFTDRLVEAVDDDVSVTVDAANSFYTTREAVERARELEAEADANEDPHDRRAEEELTALDAAPAADDGGLVAHLRGFYDHDGVTVADDPEAVDETPAEGASATDLESAARALDGGDEDDEETSIAEELDR